MNKLILLWLLISATIGSNAQKQYFVYLQSENGQPFYARYNEKTFSSTGAGYLILSKLPDSTINLKIGFANERAPEQSYSIHLNRRDRGFVIRNFGEKGWGLSDLQDQSIQYAGGGKTASSGKNSVTNTSMFAVILSKASDDPSLLELEPRIEPELAQVSKKETVKNPEPVKKEEIATSTTKTTGEEVKKDAEIKTGSTVNTDTRSVVPAVTKQTESLPKTTETGKVENAAPEVAKNDVKEVQKEAVKEDAVALAKKEETVAKVEEKKKEETPPITKTGNEKIVPVEKEKEQTTEKKEAVADKPAEDIAVKKEEPEVLKSARPGSITERVKDNAEKERPYERSVVTKKSESSTTQGFAAVFVDANADGTTDTVAITIPDNRNVMVPAGNDPGREKEEKKFLDISSEKKATDTVAVKTVITNTCNYTANNNDFFKLRKDMAAAEGNEAMLALARKYFKLKCYTVAQVKSLGALFLEDESRYQFYDAVYRHTTDPAEFGMLETELKDPYYINRFKAMLRN